MVGESTATVTTKINAHTVLFEWYRACCAIDMDHLRLCAALESPQWRHASCVVSVRWYLGARLAPRSTEAPMLVGERPQPNGYTNNTDVIGSDVLVAPTGNICSTQCC